MKKALLTVSVLAAVILLSAQMTFAADPIEVAPDMYKVIFENDQVRVLEVTFQPGQSIPEHSHPDHYVYVVDGGDLQITKADGTVTDASLQPGNVVWIDAETHKATNTGNTVVRLVVNELKESK